MKPKPGTFYVCGQNEHAQAVIATLFKAAGWKQVKPPRKVKPKKKP